MGFHCLLHTTPPEKATGAKERTKKVQKKCQYVPRVEDPTPPYPPTQSHHPPLLRDGGGGDLHPLAAYLASLFFWHTFAREKRYFPAMCAPAWSLPNKHPQTGHSGMSGAMPFRTLSAADISRAMCLNMAHLLMVSHSASGRAH